jgi:N-acetylneuraminic acid mutarotase
MEVFGTYFGSNIYVMGGYKSIQRLVSDDIEMYSLTTQVWTTLSLKVPKPLHHASMQKHSVTGIAYLSGGATQIGGAGDYNIVSGSVYSFDGTAFTTLAPLNLPRVAHASAIDTTNNKIYVAGGAYIYNSLPTYGSAEVYDIATNTWTNLTGIMNHPREHLAAAFIGGKFYTFAGRHPSATEGRELTYTEEYDPTTNVWTNKASVPTGRSGCHCVVYNNKALVFGGEGGGNSPVFDNVESYDPSTNTWTCWTPMPHPRHGMALILNGTRIYSLFGGYSSGTTLSGTATYVELTGATERTTCPFTNRPYYSSGTTGTTGGGGTGGNGASSTHVDVSVVVVTMVTAIVAAFTA